jgi:GNAT superfamily N-acetyltransferase
MLIEGFDELGTLATIYNFPYYPAHLEQLGYGKEVDWVEYEMEVLNKELNPTIAKIADICAKRNKLRLIKADTKSTLLNYAPNIFGMLNEEYQHLFGFVPLTKKQIDIYIKQFFGFILPEFVPIILDESDRMVAFCIAMPSLSVALQRCGGKLLPTGFIHLMKALKNTTRVDLCLIAVRSEYQGKGVNAMLMNYMHQVFVDRGVSKIETNPELESNHNVQGQWKFYQPRQHKRRRCFIKHLNAE